MSDVTAAETNDRLRPLLGVLAAVVVLAGLWFLVISPLLIGDGDEVADVDPSATVQPTEPATSDDGLEPDAEVDVVAALPIETYEVFLSRDPFEPVIPRDTDGTGDPGTGDPGTGDPGTGDPGTGDPGTGSPGTGDPGVVTKADVIDVFVDDTGRTRALIRVDDLLYTVGEGDVFDDGFLVVSIESPCVTLQQDGETFTLCEDGTSGPGGGGGGQEGCSGSDEVVCEGRVVTLVDVFTDEDGVATAVVQVDTTLYEVRTGDQFAQNFQVVAVDPPCVTLLFGDDAFTLCEGQRTLK